MHLHIIDQYLYFIFEVADYTDSLYKWEFIASILTNNNFPRYVNEILRA